MPGAALKGKLVILRGPASDDAAEFTAMVRRNRSYFKGLASPPNSSEKFADFVRRGELPENRFFLIRRKTDARIAGAINLSQIYRGGFQNAYLGYYVGREFAGGGLTTEAVSLIVRYAFRKLGLHRLEANVQPHNLASIAVVRKNGFRKEGFSPRYLKIGGRWRDHERWALTREDMA